MKEAASLHIKTGNIQRYCELMVEMGQVGVFKHGGGIGALTREEPRSAVGNVSGNRCSLTADPGVASSIPARSHTFVEIDHEIISMVILLPSAESFKKGCCQLQAKVCA